MLEKLKNFCEKQIIFYILNNTTLKIQYKQSDRFIKC